LIHNKFTISVRIYKLRRIEHMYVGTD